MRLFFPRDVDEIATGVHTHRRRKGEDRTQPFTVECAEPDCIEALRRYGGVDAVKLVRATYDEQEEVRERLVQQERVLPHLAKALADASVSALPGGV